MNFTHLTHPVAQRQTAGDPRNHKRDPSQDLVYADPVEQPWFPEGGVAAPNRMIVSPRTVDVGHGQANELVGPATVEWIKPRASHEQGVGVPPFKRWARQIHAEAYNFNALDVMPFPDQIGPMYLENINRPERAGWSVPKFYEQYQHAPADASMGTGVVNTRDPAGMAFAIGWGYVG